MKDRNRPAPAEAATIRAQAAALAAVAHADPDDESVARAKLNAHGIDDAEIARQLSTMASNTAGTPAVLTSYSLLHGLQHLDAIERTPPPAAIAADAVVTLFRAAEIAIGCLGILAQRMRANLEQGRLERAHANARWRAGLHELLYRASGLVAEVGAGGGDGDRLDLADSPLYRDYRARCDELHRYLVDRWREPATEIFGKELDDPRRFTFFHEFVNSADERTWSARLSGIRLAGVRRESGEEAVAFHARVVGCAEIEAMLGALETVAETDLLPFRVVHMISEATAGFVNRRLCAAIDRLLAPGAANASGAAETLALANRMLAMVDDAVKLMMRTLTPRAYSAVRPNLGMVRGTSSVVLRKTLFNATYPLAVRAFRLRIAALDPAAANDDAAIERRTRELLDSEGDEERALGAFARGLVVLHQHVRTWRDNHQQLPKTHLGVSPGAAPPTVSLSGSDSAVHIAHELRRRHERDPIAPIHAAAFGAPPCSTHELVTAGAFDEHMAHQTARADRKSVV